jgi:hypothetical protein
MKKATQLALLIMTSISVYADNFKMKYDSINTNFAFLNYRVFEWSPGFQINYFYLKNKNGLAPTAAVGYVSYNNNHSIKNGLYTVDGGFAKIGGVLYQKLSGGAIYVGSNIILSSSQQNITAEFNDQHWGTYTENYTSNDLNCGLEIALGVFGRVHKSIFMHLEGSLGTKLVDQDNPIYNKMRLSDYKGKSSIPYFSPGMGRGGILFINFSLGFGYEF